jgi:hypothetical protein
VLGLGCGLIEVTGANVDVFLSATTAVGAALMTGAAAIDAHELVTEVFVDEGGFEFLGILPAHYLLAKIIEVAILSGDTVITP